MVKCVKCMCLGQKYEGTNGILSENVCLCVNDVTLNGALTLSARVCGWEGSKKKKTEHSAEFEMQPDSSPFTL